MDGATVGTSSTKARDLAEAKPVKESTKMAEVHIVARKREPSEPRLEDIQFGEPEPTPPWMDPSAFHVEDYMIFLYRIPPTSLFRLRL